MPAKRQVARPTKRQLGFQIGASVLQQISNLADGVRDLVEKGVAHNRQTGQIIKAESSPDDIKRSWSPEQLGAVEEFIATWASEPPPPPKPPVAPPNPPPSPKPKATKTK